MDDIREKSIDSEHVAEQLKSLPEDKRPILAARIAGYIEGFTAATISSEGAKHGV